MVDQHHRATPVHKRDGYRIAGGHIAALLTSYLAAAPACGAATTIKVLVFGDGVPPPSDILSAALTLALSMFNGPLLEQLSLIAAATAQRIGLPANWLRVTPHDGDS